MNPLQLVLESHPHMVPRVMEKLRDCQTFARIQAVYRIDFGRILSTATDKDRAGHILSLIIDELDLFRTVVNHHRDTPHGFHHLRMMLESGYLKLLLDHLTPTDENLANYLLSPFFQESERLEAMNFAEQGFLDLFAMIKDRYPQLTAKLVIRCLTLMMFSVRRKFGHFPDQYKPTLEALTDMVDSNVIRDQAIPYKNEFHSHNWCFLDEQNYPVHMAMLKHQMFTPLYLYRTYLVDGRPEWLSDYLHAAKQLDCRRLIHYFNDDARIYRLPDRSKSATQICIRSLVMEESVEYDPTLALQIDEFFKRKVAPEKQRDGWHQQMLDLANGNDCDDPDQDTEEKLQHDQGPSGSC